MQPQQLEKLKNLIHGSAMLSDKEKQEWLDLLIVMNDKQISELEVILNTTDPVVKQELKPETKIEQVGSPIKPVPSLKPLSHISNLPAGVARKPDFPLARPQPKPAPNSLWQAKFKQVMDEKELPAPISKNTSSTTQHKILDKANDHVIKQQPALVKVEPVIKLTELSDVALLNLATMRSMADNLLPELKKIVKSSGYYEVLMNLEKSPLYQSYIQTGKVGLNNPAPGFPTVEVDKKYLSKAEFEAFSDLLKNLQLA